MSDERETALSAEEVAEKVRARQARTRWGFLFVIVGLLGFLGTAIILLLKDTPASVVDLGLVGMFFAMACVGAGYTEPSELSGLWKRG